MVARSKRFKRHLSYAMALLAGATLPACAKDAAQSSTPGSEATGAKASGRQSGDPLALSRRVYELGEAAWAGGAKFQAVALWRQAFRSLPPEPKFDVLRHRMVVRIGYALIELHRLDGDLYHLQAAQQMVTRWIDVRAGADESGARDEAYGLLSEIESRLEDPPAVSSADEEHELGEEARGRMLAHYDGAAADFRVQQSHAGEVLDAEGVHREIEVSRLSTIDDPKVRAFLRHPSPEGASLFDLQGDAFNPTRPLVRAGVPRITASGAEQRRHATRETWKMVRSLRPALELCYASSMARAPTEVVRMQLTLKVDDEGRVKARRSRGDALGDSIGDDCVRRVFEKVRLDDEGLRGGELAVLPLTFFIQPGRGLAPSLQGLGGFDASIGDRSTSYSVDRTSETGRGVSVGQPTQ